MTKISDLVKSTIRDVADYPKKGIVFKDISPLFQDPTLNKGILQELVCQVRGLDVDVVVGIDSRGFIMGNAMALELGVPFVMARKKGKLPYDKISETYSLEYGQDEIEIHTDSIKKGQKILIHDDLLATGGTAECVAKLVGRLGGEVKAFSFIVDLKFLNGEQVLNKYCSNIFSVVAYHQ